MSRMPIDAVVKMERKEASVYFSDWSADLKARTMLLDLVESVYQGPGDTAENAACASMMHAIDYLHDRVGYEMDPHPKGCIKVSI